MSIRILNPAGVGQTQEAKLAPRVGRPGGRPIFMLNNNKPNVDVLFRSLARGLEGAGYQVELVRKGNAAVGCREQLLARMGQEAGWVINAMGD